jgi:uncharacterized protein YkwD
MNGFIFLVCSVISVDLTETERAMLANVNAERVARGLNELKIDPYLQDGTRNHASWMASSSSMVHAKGFRENIAKWQKTSLEVHRTWMNSNRHRANILFSGATYIGVAAYEYKNKIYWCMRVK